MCAWIGETVTQRQGMNSRVTLEKNVKNFLKNFKKPIDKTNPVWYNQKAREKSGRKNWTLTIEQQRDKYKAKNSAKYRSVNLE